MDEEFHLSSLLSPPSPGVAYFPQCIYGCVSCLSVPVRLVRPSLPAVFPVSCLAFSPFASPPGADPCLFSRLQACLTLLPVLTLSRPALRYILNSELVLTFCLSMTILLPTPFGYIKHLKLQPSASCVCIWVSPGVMITL